MVNVEPFEVRAALLEDGQLAELFVEHPIAQRLVGNIYKGRVENVLPGMEAAFVNVGAERNAFLYVGDTGAVWKEDDPGEKIRPRNIRDILKPKQEIVVQVTKEAIGTKGARVTTNLTLPGRYLVLMPTMDYVGVSRRIADDKERGRLRAIADRLKQPGVGIIVRTVAEGHSEEELTRDAEFLKRLWTKIQHREHATAAPSMLYKDLGLVFRIVRDLFTEGIHRLWIDSPHEYERVQELLDMMSPQLKDRVKLYSNRERSLFQAHGLEEEIEKAIKRRVWLKCGGYIIIDQTEAFVIIDVNTGKFVGSTNLADTVLRTNLEAAEEIARQLRLRDLAGIIIVDFIDMESAEHRARVLSTLETALKRDRTTVHVLGLTQLGLVEMTRKKVRQGLGAELLRPCPYCEGRGRVLAEETMASKVRRELKEMLFRSEHEAILVEVHPSVAALLIGTGGANLKELEQETGRAIFIRGSEQSHLEGMRVRATGKRDEVERMALPVHAGEVLELKVEEPHVNNPQDGIARVEGYVVNIEGGAEAVGERVKVEIVRAFRTYAKGRIVGALPERRVPSAG